MLDKVCSFPPLTSEYYFFQRAKGMLISPQHISEEDLKEALGEGPNTARGELLFKT